MPKTIITKELHARRIILTIQIRVPSIIFPRPRPQLSAKVRMFMYTVVDTFKIKQVTSLIT